MKIYRFLLIATLCVSALIAVMTGCKYDVAEPMWDKPAPEATTPAITGVVPSQGTAGVNLITIQGQQFGDSLKDITVYFDNVQPEIVTLSSTSITVRRPNLVSTAATIKVVSAKALMAVKYSPYALDMAWQKYGTFIDNTTLTTLAVDSIENVYVVPSTTSSTAYTIAKVTTGGVRTNLTITQANEAIMIRDNSDAKVHNGMLYLVAKYPTLSAPGRDIQAIDFTTNLVAKAFRLPPGYGANYGDFDQYGNFYAGGATTDLFVVPNATVFGTNLSAPLNKAGTYQSDSILAIRVFNGYVYVVSKGISGATPAKIWKHTINASGNFGTQTPVLDMATTAFASRTITGLTISSSGNLFIVTDAADPILVFYPATNTIDYFYKNLISHIITTTSQTQYWYGKKACWGAGNNMYMIAADLLSTTDDADKWNVMQIKMGSAGSRYY